MKSMTYLKVVPLAAALLALAGCGSDNREPGAPQTATFTASAACIGCHADNKISPVTGAKIVDEWKLGAHNTKSGASCPDCHNPLGHPNGGTITSNPVDTVCQGCHTAPASTDTTAKLRAHFVSFTSSSVNAVSGATTKYGSATYVTTQEPQKCRICHNPHDNSSVLQVNRDWADSGHGDVASLAFGERNWPGSNPCVRCHTTTGYLTYVTTGAITTFTGNKEVVTCEACHVNYSWQRRALSAVVALYSTSSGTANKALNRVTYPDAKTSNICINCHVGREIGTNILNLPATTDFGNKSFENSHYLTAGATLYGVSGYENFLGVSGGANRTYTKTVAHQGLGLTVANTGTDVGPCVSCHMKNSTNHKFKPVAKDASGNVTAILSSSVCSNCHGVAGTLATTLGWSNLAGLDQRHKQWEAALEALKAQLEKRSIFFKEAHPYFYNKANPTSTSSTGPDVQKNWANSDGTTPGANIAARRLIGEPNMGAAFNFNLLEHDPGSFAHNRYYTRQLIYDSIDWLDNYTMDFSVGNTLNALSAATTYKTNAMTYLLVNGTPTGTSAERP